MKMHNRDNLKDDTAILNIVIDTLYDGIIAVDKKGIVTMISKGYAMTLGMRKEEVLGRHITEITKDTRLPIVAETGKAEIAQLQKIRNQYVVVSRIPIVKDGELTGAIAKIIFKSLKDLYNMYKSISRMESQMVDTSNKLLGTNRATYTFEDIIGESLEVRELKKFACKAAWGSSNVLLLGESGTGKELFAHAIHNESSRRNCPFVKVNCGAIPKELLESELFGYEGGSFTGAKKEGKIGKFELADGGTIFLDEIGDMPLYMQVKILRVLQEREVEKIGAAGTKKIDVRFIAATNQNLEQLVKEGRFREDLFYRLNVLTITIPPLKDRREDIEPIAYSIVDKICNKMSRFIEGISSEAMEAIKNYSWPGNIRELENVLERAITIMDNETVIGLRHIPCRITGLESGEPVRNLEDLLNDTEKEAIINGINAAKGNKTKAARLLGISRSNLYERITRLKLS